MMNRARGNPFSGRLISPLLAVLALLLAGACSPSTLGFRCEPVINDGLLLTVDLVLVDDAEERQIRELGDQWFYSRLRRQLGARTRTVSIEGGCQQTLQLIPAKGYDRLAVIADYQFEGPGGARGQMEFYSKDRWHRKTLKVSVLNTHLTITEAR